MRQFPWPAQILGKRNHFSSPIIYEPCRRSLSDNHAQPRPHAARDQSRPRGNKNPSYLLTGLPGGSGPAIREFERLPEWPRMPPRLVQDRAATVLQVQDAVQQEYGYGYKVRPFGSTCYGADTVESDIDLVILDPNNPKGFAPGAAKKGRIYNVNHLGKVLRRAGFHVDKVISKASVPIVKFRHREYNISCDINVNEQLGWRNTQLLKAYCTTMPLLPYVIRAVKDWAARRKWAPFINSYTMSLMAIGLFQAHGALPNLQKGPSTLSPNAPSSVFYSRVSKGPALLCDTRFNHKEEGWLPRLFLGSQEDALYLWYRYWGYEHSYLDCAMDIRLGGLVRRHRQYFKDTKYKPPPTPEEREENTVDMLRELDEEEVAAAAEEATEAQGVNEFDEPLTITEGDEPTAWMQHPLIVRDPFLLMKNCTARLSIPGLQQFQADCRVEADGLAERLKVGSSFEVLSKLPPPTPLSTP
ncbi:PAP associated domain-containing protein [Phanerochaete sordida]|uniref:PAP associated domain-containing protein n=1 Tax=Phanerochaete sordida TaxID=48140 RepID=A0A9P3LKC7_9APHY|nr:PAP associated domain-containing protein [Phanerochaete sordida]